MSPEQVESLGSHWRTFKKHIPVGAYLPVGQMDGDCRECHIPWPCPTIAALLTTGNAA